MKLHRCDNCSKDIPEGTVTWYRIEHKGMTLMFNEPPDADFCSMACVAEYAEARKDPGRAPVGGRR